MENNNLCNSAIIKKIENSTVWAEMVIYSACDGCHAKSFCSKSSTKNELVKIENCNSSEFTVGETVDLYLTEQMGFKSIFVAYMLPFLLFFISLIIFIECLKNELIAALSAIIITGLYYFFLYVLNKKHIIDKQFLIKMKKQNT